MPRNTEFVFEFLSVVGFARPLSARKFALLLPLEDGCRTYIENVSNGFCRACFFNHGCNRVIHAYEHKLTVYRNQLLVCSLGPEYP